jgi:Uma2 family endonuclease
MSALAPRMAYDPMYPDSDGQPMAENTLQYEWIVTLQGGFDALLPDFVGGDLLWYPVHGQPRVRVAPDVLVALGRPKGHRGSYKQWEEDGVPPTLVIEVMSPSNTLVEMEKKRQFYERYGVQEFVVYDPEDGRFMVWTRRGERLWPVPRPDGWVSPSTGVRFEVDGTVLNATGPDGRRFESYLGLQARVVQAEALAAETAAENQRLLAELRALRAERGGS